jgi:hypothetical protein
MAQAMRLAAALLAALVGASGCATKPPTQEERAAVWLAEAPRRLAVQVERELPPPDLRSRDHKVGERVGTGAVTGVGAAGYGIVDFCLRGGPLGCILGVAVSPVMFVAGAVYGAASVDSADSYHPIESAKGAAALFAPTRKPIDLPGLLEESVVAKVSASSRHAVYSERRARQGGAPPDLDGKLELSFRAFELFGDEGDDPSVALVLRVSADLSTPEDESLRWGDFTYQSPAHYVSGWKADDARLFREETGKAVRDIAAQIADKLNSSPSIMGRIRVDNARAKAAASAGIAHEPPSPVALAAPTGLTSDSSRNGLLAAGTEWTYELSDGIYGGEKSRIRVEVTDADDDFVYEKVSAIKGPRRPPTVSRAIDAREASFDLYRLDADRGLTEFAPYLFAAGGEKALKSVADAKGYPTAGYSDWVIRGAPPVWERVTVPGGTFRAVRFAIHGHRQILPFSPIAVYRFEIDVWYSPEVRRYVRLEHKTWLSGRRPNGDDVVELVEYRPPS